MIVPTRRFIVLVALGVPLALFGMVVPGFERVLIPYDLGLLILLVVPAKLFARSIYLSAHRHFDPVLSVRVLNVVELTLENTGSVRVAGRLRDESPENFEVSVNETDFELEPEGMKVIRYTVRPMERGRWIFRGTFVRILVPLGLAQIQIKLPTEQPVRVYPNVLALKEFDLLKQRGKLSQMGIRRSRIKGLGTEFESLRDYNEDDYRFIDWKSTARRGKMVVREFEQERNQAVFVCLDVGRRMLAEVEGATKLDHALDAGLMLMHAAQVAGDQVGLLLFSDVVKRMIPPRRGKSQASILLEAVHAAVAEPVESEFVGAFAYLATRWKRRSLVVVFTDAEDEDQASELTASLAQLLRHHIVIVVRVQDPGVNALTLSPLSTIDDVYKSSAAAWYKMERQRGSGILSAAGVHQIEAEPAQLSSALVNAYHNVKRAAQL